jgi:hypothetical protein
MHRFSSLSLKAILLCNGNLPEHNTASDHPLGQNQKRTFLIECAEFAVVTVFADYSNLGVTL